MSANAVPNPEQNPPTPQPDLLMVPPSPAEAGPQPVRRQPPGRLNKKQQAQIFRAEVLIPICREPVFVVPLAVRGIDEAFLVALEGKIKAARDNSTAAVNCTVAGMGCTLLEADAERALMEALRELQGAARLKYLRTDPIHLGRYLIGEPIYQSRPLLEQSAAVIIENANADRPPPVDSAMIEAAKAKLKDYKDSKQPQTDEKAAAVGARVSRDGLVREITNDRQQIQLAAESAWPHTDPANAPIRLKFRLPPKQRYTA